MKKPSAGGGWQAVRYTLKTARESGGVWKMWKAMRSKNACKTCALGMGGQQGGMVNERGSFPEVCKKSLQAMGADMQPPITSQFWTEHPLEKLRQMTPYQLERCGRLAKPVIHRRGEAGYREIEWSEAMRRVADQLLEATPNRSFFYFSGRSSNEAGFLLQLFARLFGTNNVNNCSYYCHQASGVGLQSSLGSGTATITLEDLEHADLVFLIGGNPPSNHPRMMTSLMHLRRRGGKVIVINPVVELGLVRFRVPSDARSMAFGTEIASTYVQPHIGGDLALLTGIAKRIVEVGAHDQDFLQQSCRGSDAWLEHLQRQSWDEIVQKSGVDRTQINELAEIYRQSSKAVFAWTMGITHHAHGVQNVQAIANLALARGMVGKPHCGLLPIRGHSNVQGIGSVGVTPQLKQAIFDALRERYSVSLPTSPGLDTLACMEAAHRGELRTGVCLGGNLFGSNPDSAFAEAALSRLKSLVFLNTTLNTGHVQGLAEETIILPVLARDEEPQPTTQESMFNYVRLSDGGPRRFEGPRSEVELVAELGERVLRDTTPIDWKTMRETGKIRQMIAEVVPGYQAVADLDKNRQEFQIEGRTFHQPRFGTDDGNAVLHCHDLPPLATGQNQLRMMTVRSEGQFNTVVYEETDIYRGQQRRDVILVHPDDLDDLGLTQDQVVTVVSRCGELPRIQVRAYPEIRPGNALMYFPEANVLVPREVDAQSRTPAFKGVLVSLVSS